jgi:phosphotransferase system, enzyme I, PtsP
MAPTVNWSGSRQLLRQLRDTMRSSGSAESRLQTIVEVIASEMKASVCSCYITRAGEVLELVATQGLNRSAIHQTRLRIGEGLVGIVAAREQTEAFEDAPSHPQFAYRPETGEDPFHSLLGIPILRSERLLGVLVIQSLEARRFEEDERESLETIAMLLAELIASSEFLSDLEKRGIDYQTVGTPRLVGQGLVKGFARGFVAYHDQEILIRRFVAENETEEQDRLSAAMKALQLSLENLSKMGAVAGDQQSREIMNAYKTIAADRGWLRKIREAIKTGLTAEAALHRTITDYRARFNQITDPYLKERVADINDIATRLMKHLVEQSEGGVIRDKDLGNRTILAAKTLGPAELLDYNPENLSAILLEEGSANAHAVILAKSMNIPVIARIKNLFNTINDGDEVLVNAHENSVIVRPRNAVADLFEESVQAFHRRRSEDGAQSALPSITKDEKEVGLFVNAGLMMDVAHLEETGAAGIGLFRTELAFMARQGFPTVEEQTEFYTSVMNSAGQKAVNFRTLDVGGDKVLPYWSNGHEENPAMGWRAIRVGLDRPAMLRQQLRGLIRAGDGKALRVMFPMISEASEFFRAKEIFDLELAHEKASRDVEPNSVSVGIMLEVPGLIWQLDQLAPHLDFISVGTNDLLQFAFAADRNNPQLSNRFDTLSPAALALLKSVAECGNRHGVTTTVCGEIAGSPLEAMALIGCGFNNFSMSWSSVSAVKAMVRSLDSQAIAEYVEYTLTRSYQSLRQPLLAFAKDHAVRL